MEVRKLKCILMNSNWRYQCELMFSILIDMEIITDVNGGTYINVNIYNYIPKYIL